MNYRVKAWPSDGGLGTYRSYFQVCLGTMSQTPTLLPEGIIVKAPWIRVQLSWWGVCQLSWGYGFCLQHYKNWDLCLTSVTSALGRRQEFKASLHLMRPYFKNTSYPTKIKYQVLLRDLRFTESDAINLVSLQIYILSSTHQIVNTKDDNSAHLVVWKSSSHDLSVG